MNRKRVVIASVLKPVSEPRMFGRFALSLRETNKYHLNIIGFCLKINTIPEGIHFTCIFNRKRTHCLRLVASLKFLKELFRYRPALVIVTTYELLPVAVLAKPWLKFKLIYDLPENYSKNISSNKSLFPGLRNLASGLVNVLEKVGYPFVDHYFFAERSYPFEFPHIRKYTVLENKFWGETAKPNVREIDPDKVEFIIAGTITPVYGIEAAINWFLELLREKPGFSLTILGHVPIASFKNKLEKKVNSYSQIKLGISEIPVPHSVVIDEIKKKDVVLMPYENIDSIRDKIPAKLYECLALSKPILITDNPRWNELISRYPAGLGIDFWQTSDALIHLERLFSLPLYERLPGEEVHWSSERPYFLKAIDEMLG